ncbi:MAG: helix-turn-helix domain-containing protein [Roseibium sp.]
MLFDLHFEDREEALEFHQNTVDADFDIIKFDPGDIHLGLSIVEFPDLFIFWARATGNMRWTAQHSNNLPCFFFAYETEWSHWGRDLSPSHAVFGRAQSIREGGFNKGCTTLDITVSQKMSDQLGWDVGDDRILETNPQILTDLRKLCQRATIRSRQLQSQGYTDWPKGEGERWQSLILDVLERAANPWLEEFKEKESRSQFPNSRQLALNAEAFLHEYVAEGAIPISQLANELSVPERTLYNSFRRSLGVSPRRYLEILRLHRFRKRLKAASDTDSNVLEIAHELGFSEFGRLAGLYKKQFGELPNETLKSGNCKNTKGWRSDTRAITF